MNAKSKHSWEQLDGFRRYRCTHCGVIHRWDDDFKKMIYETIGKIWTVGRPECKRTYFSDAMYSK